MKIRQNNIILAYDFDQTNLMNSGIDKFSEKHFLVKGFFFLFYSAVYKSVIVYAKKIIDVETQINCHSGNSASVRFLWLRSLSCG